LKISRRFWKYFSELFKMSLLEIFFPNFSRCPSWGKFCGGDPRRRTFRKF
jgi:hypothetical protein